MKTTVTLRRTATAVSLGLALLATSTPVLAQTPVPVPVPGMRGTQAPPAPAAAAVATPVPNPAFIACLDAAVSDAIRQGAPAGEARGAVTGLVAPDQGTLDASRVQPESRLEIWDYLAGLVDDERVADGGRAFLSQREYLTDLGRRTGVDPATVVGIWGVETNFGTILGRRNVIHSLSSLACTGHRRATFFRSELVAAIRILAAGHVQREHFVGSWAGAFGQTQFMPTTFWSLAVDGTGDGRRDIIDEPRDALASTANYLRRSGWVPGQRWGYEVRLPAGYAGPTGRTNRRSLRQWAGLGLRLGDGGALPDAETAYGLILPAGPRGPGFLVGRNFDAVRAYNPADSYALAVNLLADRIKGMPGVVQPWPTDDPPLSRAERREVQQLLLGLGYDIGAPDGILGARSKDAIQQFQRSRGLPVEARAGQRLLRTLRAAAPR
jgi:lytic murein transglycosylase